LSQGDVNPDSKGKGGVAPVIIAAENGHEAVVRLLLGRCDVNPDPKGDRSRTLLWWAA
jgi:ankyrin repeat protein